jgi:hypothetical protein
MAGADYYAVWNHEAASNIFGQAFCWPKYSAMPGIVSTSNVRSFERRDPRAACHPAHGDFDRPTPPLACGTRANAGAVVKGLDRAKILSSSWRAMMETILRTRATFEIPFH